MFLSLELNTSEMDNQRRNGNARYDQPMQHTGWSRNNNGSLIALIFLVFHFDLIAVCVRHEKARKVQREVLRVLLSD